MGGVERMYPSGAPYTFLPRIRSAPTLAMRAMRSLSARSRLMGRIMNSRATRNSRLSVSTYAAAAAVHVGSKSHNVSRGRERTAVPSEKDGRGGRERKGERDDDTVRR